MNTLPQPITEVSPEQHQQLIDLLLEVGASWGMPEAGAMQLAETIESIFES
jgi:hypothetical protein